MKLYIEYQFKDGPYGGANQFLKNLKNYLVKQGLYAETPEEADCILINHTNISSRILRLKEMQPEKILIHRMDGPVCRHRKYTLILDKSSFFLDRILCEGTVFQSTWTKENCISLGYRTTGRTAVIHNAPSPEVFQKETRERRKRAKGKLRLVSTSWSDNWNKGFDALAYLDEHLDFDRYECTFIGRSPIAFKQIRQLPAMASRELAEELKQHDIFLAVSRSESCSNALIEAINSGLVVVARDSGCFAEIMKEGGILCQRAEEMPAAIEKAAADLEMLKERLPYYSIEDIGRQYTDFCLSVSNALTSGEIRRKRFGKWRRIEWESVRFCVKVYTKLYDFCKRKLDGRRNRKGC